MVSDIGDQRAGARAAARPDRNALRLRPFDEVGDDQEVAGKLHPRDDAELEVEPLAVVVLDVARRAAVARQMPLEPFARPGGAARSSSSTRAPSGSGEARQDRLARQRPEGAAQRDLDAVVERLRQIGEQRAHFGAGLEAMLGRQAAAVGGADQRAFGDAQQRVVRLVIVGGGEIGLVGGDQRQARAHRRDRSAPARRGARSPGRGAAIRHRAGRRTAARAASAALRASSGRPSASARSIGPAGPPVSAIRPSDSASAAKSTCGSSPSVGSSQTREASRIRRGSPVRPWR